MRNRLARAAAAVTAAAALAHTTGCDGADTTLTRGSLSGRLDGSGATFPDPVFQEWMTYYGNSVETRVQIDYQPIGSGGGIEQFLADRVDFGSSERYLEESELAVARQIRGCRAVQFPVLFGSVAVALHDRSLDGLVLSAEVLAQIYDRQITRYNDPAIAALNPGRTLPHQEIVPVHRSDSSGTTFVLTHYLATEVPFWADTYAEGTDLGWHPDTLGGEGNEGVTGTVLEKPGGLGYVNQSYALRNDLATARVVNEDGRPVAPTLAATTAASEEARIPDDFQFTLDDIGGRGYPIAGATFIFGYTCGYDEDTAAILRGFWTWALNDVQADERALDLGYAPMGRRLKERVTKEIQRINSEPGSD